LFACLALITGSIVVIPASAVIGVRGDAASMLSSIALLGGIVAAFLTVNEEADAKAK